MRRCLLLAVVAAMVGWLVSDVRSASRLHAQNAANPAFEVASIKPNKSGDGRILVGFQPGGRFTATGITLRMLIGLAFAAGQPMADSQIVGGPSWMDSDRFDIVAKAEGDPQPGPDGPLPLMVRSLLADRFKLVTHNESRELPIYALAKARSDGKLGAQLIPSTVDCAALRGRRGGVPPPGPPAFGQRPPCGARMAPGNIAAGSFTMAQLAGLLSRFTNRIVQDRTGLTGGFDLDLTWTPDQMPQLPPGGLPPGAPPLPPIDPNGPSIFTAVQEQLGLKLDSTRAPVDVLVIDGAEHPTED